LVVGEGFFGEGFFGEGFFGEGFFREGFFRGEKYARPDKTLIKLDKN
jgi:hypothetical protein